MLQLWPLVRSAQGAGAGRCPLRAAAAVAAGALFGPPGPNRVAPTPGNASQRLLAA